MELAKTYNPGEIETKWYPIWEQNGYFKPSFKEGASNYAILLPPPNVTGTLHMGHGFQHTLMDMLIRYHRMLGDNTLWQVGTDHAGIATQIVVERQLDGDGITRQDIGREEFLRKVWQWKELSGSTITSQMRRLGASCDWSREHFTMDKDLSIAVTEVFVSLFEKGYIYRGKRLVNWDIKLQTAVSDLEVISEEEQGYMWYIRYPVKDSNESVVIATTRPETLLGDVAVAVSPEDTRYTHLIGKQLILPLVGREIPVIADSYVEAGFGTGCVKITPAHDFNDYEVGLRHNLPKINIFTLDGCINHESPDKYRGLERFVARKLIISDLENLGLLVETKAHKLVVPRGDRTGVIIEPMLTDQWYVAMEKFAKKGLELVEQGEVQFVPENWSVIYNQWLNNIQDWCISRQLWWGHRIPVYYDESGKHYVARNLDDAIKQAETDKLTQDADVLDTWFSSGLWAFSTLGWPNKTPELNAFLPSNVLVTGFDIIFFWVARMIMFTHEFTGKVPFKDVYVTGLIQDAHGNKMSKSKGNVIDPLDLVNGISIEDLLAKRTQNLMNPKQANSIAVQTRKDYPSGFLAFGADAVRFTFSALATHGREVRFDVRRIEGSRNFCNKLWNATRFVIMNTENQVNEVDTVFQLSLIDHWIVFEFIQLIKDVEYAYSTYRFDIATQKMYEFIWNEYCDWYVELAKVNINGMNAMYRMSTIRTLLLVLEASLRVLHPIMPFITEELWQVVATICGKKYTPSIMLANYPTIESMLLYSQVDHKSTFRMITDLKEIITSIRNLRSEMNLNLGIKVPLVIEASADTLAEVVPYIKSLAKISQVDFVSTLDENSSAPIARVVGVRLMLKVEIDITTEKLRLTKEIEKNIKELEKIKLKLDNQAFISRAPKDLVEREVARSNEIEQVIIGFKQQLAKL